MTTNKNPNKPVKKITVEDLRKMVKEAVISFKKEKALLEQKSQQSKNKGKTVRVTVEQLRTLVKEAVRVRLQEDIFSSDDMTPTARDAEVNPGDLVAYNGKTFFVDDAEGQTSSIPGQVFITNDGIKGRWVSPSELQVLATGEDLEELSPDEMTDINANMGWGTNKDPGMDPQEELDAINLRLDSKLISKESRRALHRKKEALEAKLGVSSQEMGEAADPTEREPYDRDTHGYRKSMTFGQMPSDEELAAALEDGWHMDLKGQDAISFKVAMEMAGLRPDQAQRSMSTVQGMKQVIEALVNCYSEDPDLANYCENAENLASSIMDVLGFEWI